MFLYTYLIILFLSTAMSKPRYVELDEDEQELFRNVYDTPPYQDDCDDDDGLQLGKVDLVKDGMWALKAKMKELKAFNKALAANLLSTKLKLKELVMNKIVAKKYGVLEKKKQHGYEIYEPQYAPFAAVPYGHDPYLGL
ncbi:unnamed protein product [Colias eurytheme]|nr:unnamed protein product [Colias eurytheme]